MNSRFLDVLHDTRDEDILVLVCKSVDINLDGVAQVGINQHRCIARDLHCLARIALDAGAVVDDLHRAAAQHVGRANDDRVADLLGDGDRLFLRDRRAVVGLAELQILNQFLEAITILGQIDRVWRRAENGNTRGLERLGKLERRLATELNDQSQQFAAPALDLDQLDDVLGGQWLEVEPVGRVVVR